MRLTCTFATSHFKIYSTLAVLCTKRSRATKAVAENFKTIWLDIML